MAIVTEARQKKDMAEPALSWMKSSGCARSYAEVGDRGRAGSALATALLIGGGTFGLRPARSRISGANLFVVLLIQDPPSQELEPPANPARFNFKKLYDT